MKFKRSTNTTNIGTEKNGLYSELYLQSRYNEMRSLGPKLSGLNSGTFLILSGLNSRTFRYDDMSVTNMSAEAHVYSYVHRV